MHVKELYSFEVVWDWMGEDFLVRLMACRKMRFSKSLEIRGWSGFRPYQI